MEVNDKVFIYCYNVDDLPNKTPDFEEIKDLEGRSYFAIDKIKATNVKIVTKCNGHRSLKLKRLNFWNKSYINLPYFQINKDNLNQMKQFSVDI